MGVLPSEATLCIYTLWVSVLSFLLFGITAWYAVSVFKMGFSESSPSLQIIMAVPFFSLLILSCTVSFYSLLSLLKKIKYWRS